jgi:hypothetical protein
MNQRNVTFAWLGSILLIAIFAGVNWITLVLAPDAGGQSIAITGYLVFPITSALIMIQAAGLLASFFTPNIVGRVLSGALVPFFIWHLINVVTNLESSLQAAIATEITKATGVVGVASQSQLVQSALDSNAWYLYVVAVGLNIAVLILKSTVDLKPAKAPHRADQKEDPGDLWESQN